MWMPVFENLYLLLLEKTYHIGCNSHLYLYENFDIFSSADYDFVLVAGDDVTDEDMFEKLPEDIHSIKIGHKQTAAKYTVSSSEQFIDILSNFKN